MIQVCIYMYTSMTQLAIFNASEGVWPWVQFESVHPTLVLPSTAVQGQWPGNRPWRCCSSCTNGRFRFPTCVWGWFIVGPVWLKMCRIVTKHPGDAEESSPQLRFFHRFARFKTIHQSVFKHPKTKIRRQNSKSPAGRWRPTWWVTTLPWTPVPRARFPDNNMMFLACAVCLPGRWKYFKLEIPCLIHWCPSSTEVQLLRCSKKCIVYSRCVKYV